MEGVAVVVRRKNELTRTVIAFALALVITVLVAGSASALTGDMLRTINLYGAEYRPFVPEQLRLVAPANESPPDFTQDSYANLVAAKVVSGEYYLAIEDHFSDLPKDLTDAQGIVIARSRQLCGITGSDGETSYGETNQQRGCYNYYYDIGKQAYNLRTIKAFNVCKGNVRSMINNLNEQIDIDNVTAIGAGVEFATIATAYKWCTVNFGQNLTVVAPTPENTKFSPPEGWEPVVNRTPADDWETIDAATAKEMLSGGKRKNVTNAAVASNTTGAPAADSTAGQSWMLTAVYITAGLCVVVIIVAIVLFVRKRKAAPVHEQHHARHEQHRHDD